MNHPPALRGHHLICLQHYRGEGYDARFVENLTEIVDTASATGATVVEGADDVCAACPDLACGLCVHDEGSEAEVRRIDALAMDLLGVSTGDVVDFGVIRERAAEALDVWRRDACVGCEWLTVCEAWSRT